MLMHVRLKQVRLVCDANAGKADTGETDACEADV